MITYQSHGLIIGETWFDEPSVETGVDILRYFYSPFPIPHAHIQQLFTPIIDLRLDAESLINQCNRRVRNSLRHAQQEFGVNCGYHNPVSAEQLAEFCQFYHRFAAERHLNPICQQDMQRLADRQRLDISYAWRGTGEILVYHMNYFNGTRVRIMYSSSFHQSSNDPDFRRLVGCANSSLHWHDMLRFKASGATMYDLGGWYNGNDDEALLRINRFKALFGGTVITEYNCERGVTLRGKSAVWLRKALRRL